MNFDWDTADARARDGWIAEHVIRLEDVQDGRLRYWFTPTNSGYTPDNCKPRAPEDMPDKVYFDGRVWKRVPDFTTDAAADYLVLERVRETWKTIRVCEVRDHVKAIWDKRAWEDRERGGVPWGCCQYRTGDWSHAAYLALQETER